jgi:ArsR family transcriptional regulator, arsenate/arsenite/antimonite-responsive transcriptional repressor
MSDICNKIQALGKGISSPSRYRIIEALMKGSKTVGDVVESVGLSQPAVSQHLATLKACGLVDSIKQGQEVFYTLNARYMLDVLKHLTSGVQQCKEIKIKTTAKAVKAY